MSQSANTAGGEVALLEKREALIFHLGGMGRLMVAYSGGADSAYLAYMAYRLLGDEMLAVTADSPSLSRAHLRDAVAFAAEHGIPLKVVDTNEMKNPDYVRNDGARCFHCKDELFKVMSRVGVPLGFSVVAYGMNLDDVGDFRPRPAGADAVFRGQRRLQPPHSVPGAEGCGAARRDRPAGEGRPHQARHSPTRAPRGAPHLGQAGVGVSVFPRRLRPAGDTGDAGLHRKGGGCPFQHGIPAISRQASRRVGPHRNRTGRAAPDAHAFDV